MNLEEALLKSVSGKEPPVEGVWIGLTWTAIESRFVGMSHTYNTKTANTVEDAGNLLSCKISNLTNRILSWNPLEATIGVAAINSLIEPHGEVGNIKDFIKNKSRGKTVTFIGRFPFYADVSAIAKKAYLLEINPEGDEFPSFACEEFLPQSDINVISGTSLINHSLQRLLELGQNGINIVVGPTTPLSSVLFEFGADILAGVRVVDKHALITSVTQGVRTSKFINGIEPVYLHKKSKK